MRALLWIVGIAVGLMSVSVSWSYDPGVRYLGFPFPGVVFELWTNRHGQTYWADFAGPVTLPVLAVDFLLCMMLPQVALAAVLMVRSDSGAANR